MDVDDMAGNMGLFPIPRSFTAWVLAGGTLHSLPLRVSRRLAVAMRTPDRDGDLGLGGKRRITAALPRGASADHVYEVDMDEADFASGLEVGIATSSTRGTGRCDSTHTRKRLNLSCHDIHHVAKPLS
jgi:hypothetical protein